MVNKIKSDILLNHDQFESLVFSKRQNVQVSADGYFTVENETLALFKRIIQKLTLGLINFDRQKYINFAKGYVEVLNRLEQSLVTVHSHSYDKYMKLALKISNLLGKYLGKEAKRACFDLKIRRLSLINRLEKNLSYENVPLSSLKQLYIKKIEEWKITEAVFNQPKISDDEERLLDQLLKYPQFASTLLENKDELKRFFEFAFIEKNNIDVFAQFYQTTYQLMDSLLSDRIGRYGGTDLQITTKDSVKDLTLLFEGQRKSILDEKHEITFKHDYVLTIGEIFKTFKDRSFRVGDLEYFGDGQGIVNWNPNQWGSYDPTLNEGSGGYRRVDVKDPQWIKKMPFSLVVSEKDAKNMFLDKEGKSLEFSEDEWVFSAVAKNRYKEANPHGTHMMLAIACPIGNGERGIGYLSKFTWDFPQNTKDYIKVIKDPMPAAIQWPDENFFQVRRKEAHIAFKATAPQAALILEKIARNKQNVEQGNMFFQILDYNCGCWVFKKIEPLISKDEALDLAGLRLIEARPSGVVGKVFSLWRRFPKLMSFIFNIFFKFFKPKPLTKLKRDGTRRVIKLDLQSLPWNNLLKKIHPEKIISLQKHNKSLLNQESKV